MELRNLNTFVRAADAGSFSRAASELGYTQSTVTAQIQGLEEELGVQLFDRLPKGITLTRPGEVLLKYARSLLLEAENGWLSKARGSRRASCGSAHFLRFAPRFCRIF